MCSPRLRLNRIRPVPSALSLALSLVQAKFKPILRKFRAAAVCLRRSTVRMAEVMRIQKVLDANATRKVLIDSLTRWNSSLHMMKRLNQVRFAIQHMFASAVEEALERGWVDDWEPGPDESLDVSESEWILMEALLPVRSHAAGAAERAHRCHCT
jgi:hypothetical protein